MTIYNVKSAAELQSALGKAVGGDSIVLGAGNYGRVSIANRQFSSEVKIVAGASGVHFDGLMVAYTKNVSLSGIDLGRALAAGEPDYSQLNTVKFSSNIKLINVDIHGSLDGNPVNDGVGLYVTDSQDVAVVGSRFQELWRGMSLNRVTGLTIDGNEFKKIRSDGATFSGNDNVFIRKNVFLDFNGYGTDHCDAIQFWNNGQNKGQSNIRIENNIFMQTEAGKGAQGIFMSDPQSYKYSNVVIQNNLMYSNDQYNGITVVGGSNVQILDNTVLSSSVDGKQFWIRVDASENVVAKNNVTDRFQIRSDVVGLSMENNLTVSTVSGAVAKFGNIDAPKSIYDLLLPDNGFQPDRLGPTGGFVGTALMNFLTPKAPAAVLAGSQSALSADPILAAPAPASAPAPAPAPAPASAPTKVVSPAPAHIYGTAGSDSVKGGAGADKIWGVAATGSKLGKGTVDSLTGGAGKDIFVLGDKRGVFYDEGTGNSAGRGDYARILDFQAGDKIQIHGHVLNHFQKAGTVDGKMGMQIFHDSNGSGAYDSRDELIALVVGVYAPIASDAFVLG
jgi:Ca2+-binding RTX toxin-like protein